VELSLKYVEPMASLTERENSLKLGFSIAKKKKKSGHRRSSFPKEFILEYVVIGGKKKRHLGVLTG
jgi:hypothetical protein